MKVLFLDIDGVLNNATDFFELKSIGHPINHKCEVMNRGLVCLLSDIITKTDAKIVISSTWREMMALDQIYEILLSHDFQHGRDCIIGATPSHRRGMSDNPKWHRGREIAEYLENNEVEKFLIIDDNGDAIVDAGFQKTSTSQVEEEGDNFIHTNAAHGLDVYQTSRAINILGRNAHWEEEQAKYRAALELMASCII